MLNIRLERHGDKLHVVLPLLGKVDAWPSATGKSMVLASTEGAYDLRQIHPGMQVPVMLEVNLYVPNGMSKPEGGK